MPKRALRASATVDCEQARRWDPRAAHGSGRVTRFRHAVDTLQHAQAWNGGTV